MERAWINLSKRYSHVSTGEYVVMPNHFHGIVMILSENQHSDPARSLPLSGWRAEALPLQSGWRAEASSAPTVGTIVQSFKSICVTDYLKHIKKNNLDAIAKIWQKNYYEHIIRDDDELNRIREYINSNPQNWATDEENPANVVANKALVGTR